jgi:hypothetical protein
MTIVADVFVALNGNDAWSGTLDAPNSAGTDGPVATIAKAQSLIRTKIAQNPARNYLVLVRGGIYPQAQPLIFTELDTVYQGYSVTWENYPGERAVISGGRPLTGWAVSFPSGQWTLTLPGGTAITEFYVGGARCKPAVRPSLLDAQGQPTYLYVATQVAATGTAPYSSDPLQSPHPGEELQGNNRFGFNPGDWTAADIGCMVEVNAGECLIPLAAVDSVNNIATLGSHCLYNMLPVGTRLRRVGSPRDGLLPGEFYLNPSTNVLTYSPRPGETPENVIAPLLTRLVEVSNSTSQNQGTLALGYAGRLNFNLGFAHTATPKLQTGYQFVQEGNNETDAAIVTTGATAVNFDRSVFAHMGDAAIYWALGTFGCRAERSIFHDLGGGAIYAGLMQYDGSIWPATPQQNMGFHKIVNNLVDGYGRTFYGDAAIWIGNIPLCDISHNEVRHGASFGISVGFEFDWNGNDGSTLFGHKVHKNHVHHLGTWSKYGSQGQFDFGAIYLRGLQPGTTVDFNLLHHVGCYAGLICGTTGSGGNPQYGFNANAIYGDYTASELLIENNLVYLASWAGYYQQGHGNTVQNNIFALSTNAPLLFEPDGTSNSQATFQRNIIYWEAGAGVSPYVNGNGSVDQVTFATDYNLYFCKGATLTNYAMYDTIADWQNPAKYNRDVHSLFNADPLFTNPDGGDFTLAPNSPALGLGFVPFDVSDAGILPDHPAFAASACL